MVFFNARLHRAWNETPRFSIETDVLPPVAVAVVAWWLTKNDEQSKLGAIFTPLAVGLVMLGAVHLLRVLWNYAAVPARVALEQERRVHEKSLAQIENLTAAARDTEKELGVATAKVAAYESKQPLRMKRTAHEGKWRRVVVENPNYFVASGCYVAVESYVSTNEINQATYPLPTEGFKFGWGTWQNNPQGDIGAQDSLIVDIVEWRNIDHFTHVAPSDNAHQYVPAWALPYGVYIVNVTLGARSTSIPLGRGRFRISFAEGDLTLDVLED